MDGLVVSWTLGSRNVIENSVIYHGDVYATRIYDLALTSMIGGCLANGNIEDNELAVIETPL